MNAKPSLAVQCFRSVFDLVSIKNRIRELRPMWSDPEIELEANLILERKTKLAQKREKKGKLRKAHFRLKGKGYSSLY